MLRFHSSANPVRGESPAREKRPEICLQRVLATLLTTLALTLYAAIAQTSASAEVVRTGYTSITATSTSQCLDIKGGSKAAGPIPSA